MGQLLRIALGTAAHLVATEQREHAKPHSVLPVASSRLPNALYVEPLAGGALRLEDPTPGLEK